MALYTKHDNATTSDLETWIPDFLHARSTAIEHIAIDSYREPVLLMTEGSVVATKLLPGAMAGLDPEDKTTILSPVRMTYECTSDLDTRLANMAWCVDATFFLAMSR